MRESVLFTIDKTGNLTVEYQGKKGVGCVEEINEILTHVGGHVVEERGNTDDYYRPSVETELSRWVDA